ncbi:bifunctional threonine ammonia-lyase/L-serine ammonia-lyase TdcB [Staphylococcus simulans]|uniref:bifunctional threonine ammonia-lyase/L-serine ammonia-lyase TdcB n=1 Tax=Staphylococcus simulans TaxID=1286 RepID=UPI000D0461A3|nr:bifunctional threonine ammonia-lyase/L-serine ammonia-lyase TdcB [Staphylococcus simulans]PTJ01986.1 bifunctional threonine ammonia-lyase/L-serine ammonia-lyase TdcB [Staphylococcus simulans]PTJ18615.1 bifunctional threonine ammonia-lyase/L-serine ammonia-lyase TdcB [Staphylococcus simulans]PTJ46158.1 bifunctional threonine ammonia-lyase/L-serine ammonia-lyase TdcB [Staphylococcus simulans]PTJ86894.1 bifunctional threonine ammonia-lyase/L-serine ammonia-lyase TdcB [Staphylococcus simulans]U
MTVNSTVMQTEKYCNIQDIKEAKMMIRDYVRKTPLIQSMFLSNDITGGDVYLKLENMQFTGSFKYRGALNKILHLTEEQKEKGIITASAGNHAQGLALTGKLLGIKATVIMPEEAPIAKQEATRGYGAEVILKGETFNDSRLYMEQLAKETGKTIVHPYDDNEVMAGQGTIGLEILDSIWNVNTVIVPVGGGGLISGVATALKSFNPSIHVIGVQAENVHGMAESVKQGKITSQFTAHTIADGTEVAIPGEKTYEVADKLVDEFILVTEDEISNAMRHLMQRAKIITEGAGALPTAAILSGKIDPKWLKNKATVALVSGGNVDLTRVSHIIDTLLEPADTSEGVVG